MQVVGEAEERAQAISGLLAMELSTAQQVRAHASLQQPWIAARLILRIDRGGTVIKFKHPKIYFPLCCIITIVQLHYRPFSAACNAVQNPELSFLAALTTDN